MGVPGLVRRRLEVAGAGTAGRTLPRVEKGLSVVGRRLENQVPQGSSWTSRLATCGSVRTGRHRPRLIDRSPSGRALCAERGEIVTSRESRRWHHTESPRVLSLGLHASVLVSTPLSD
jgi:hypothetical protein